MGCYSYFMFCNNGSGDCGPWLEGWWLVRSILRIQAFLSKILIANLLPLLSLWSTGEQGSNCNCCGVTSSWLEELYEKKTKKKTYFIDPTWGNWTGSYLGSQVRLPGDQLGKGPWATVVPMEGGGYSSGMGWSGHGLSRPFLVLGSLLTTAPSYFQCWLRDLYHPTTQPPNCPPLIHLATTFSWRCRERRILKSILLQ